ncbi:serine protease [Candidatus Pelagibacter sp.]|nr:serine protease [Candidatus Pelagibacter sp.]
MKKLLGIVVLGLLLSGNAYAKIQKWESQLSPGSSKKQMCEVTHAPGKDDYCHSSYQKYYIHLPSHRTEIIVNPRYHNGDLAYFIYENVNVRMKCKFFSGCKHGDGTLKKIAYSEEEAYAYADPTLTASFLNKKKEEKIIAEKPKKKKPKQLPEDNKVVPAGSGSGFIVSNEGHVITNHHVIDGCNTTKVSFKGNQVDAQILAVDKMNDIAILKTNIKPDSIFPISNEDVSLLEDVVVAGYPLGKQVSSAIKTHKGVVTALAGAGDNYSNFQTDASINAGNSGGPIMNQKGNIVGIAVATWVQDGVQGVHFGIKSSTLKTFANSNSLKFSSPNYLELSNKDLGKLITEATVYLECHMTVAKIKRMIAEANNQKAFFSEFK